MTDIGWATVKTTGPVTIRPDGATSTYTPDKICGTSPSVNARVLFAIVGGKVVIWP